MSGKFIVAVQKPRQIQQGGGSQFNLADSYELEREALDPIGAEIVEIDAETDGEFIEPVSYTHLTLPTIYSV